MDEMDKITVILPCAGEGRRLGLKTPKELFEVFPDKRLIDYSLAHVLAEKKRVGGKNISSQLKVVVVIQPWKTSVVDYVKKILAPVHVTCVLFDDAFEEWPGSVFSARDFFSHKNIVLLPDSFLSLSAQEPVRRTKQGKPVLKTTLIQLMREGLSEGKAVFGYVPCKKHSQLKNLGAVYVNKKNLVTRFQDKPSKHFGSYNGFWGCYAFRQEIGRDLYAYLIQSVKHSAGPIQNQAFYPVKAVRLHDYYDMGTWKSIRQLQTAANGPRAF